MSVLPLGLAESVREWFSTSHGGGTAVETAAPVEVAVKPKTVRARKKKADETATDTPEGDSGADVAQTAIAEPPKPIRRPPPPRTKRDTEEAPVEEKPVVTEA